MAHALTPTPAEPGTENIVVPDSGDARTAASVQVPFQSVTDLIFWIYGVLLGTISKALTLANSLRVNGLLNAAGGLNVTGTANVNGSLLVASGNDATVAGRTASLKGFDGRVVSVANADNQDYDPAVADVFYIGAAGAHYDHFIVPSITGLAGRRIVIACAALGNSVAVHALSTPGSPFTIQGASGTADSLEFVFLSDTVLKLINSHVVP